MTNIEDNTGLRGAAAVDATRQRLGSLNQLNEVLTLTLPDLAVRNLSKTTDALLITPGPASEQISDLLFNWQAGQRERLIGSAERGMGVGSDPVIFETGGNPYGFSMVGGSDLGGKQKQAIAAQVKRTLKIAEKLK